MGNLSAKERISRCIEQASTEEILCIVAIIMACKEDKLKGYKCPDMPTTRGAYKRAVKRLRSAQARHPEGHKVYEDAVQFIRREWLHREAVKPIQEIAGR